MSFFFFYFSFQTRKDLALAKFYNAAFDVSWKLLENLLIGTKTSAWSKISQRVIAFIYLASLNYFLFCLHVNFTYFWKIFLTKKIRKTGKLFCKGKFSQKFRDRFRDLIYNEVLITLVSLCDKRASVC